MINQPGRYVFECIYNMLENNREYFPIDCTKSMKTLESESTKHNDTVLLNQFMLVIISFKYFRPCTKKNFVIKGGGMKYILQEKNI